MNPRLPLLLALAIATAACGPKVAKDKPGAQDAPFVFPHSTHVDADVACTNCHPMQEARKLENGVRHVRIPANAAKKAECQDCHDKDPAPKLPPRARPFRLNFDHAAHLPRVKGDCKRCHPAPPEQGDAQAKTPSMAVCTGCHNHNQDFAEARCMPCHRDLKGYATPQTAFVHQGDWLRAHGQLAHPSAESCAACHDQTFCVECHSPQTVAGRPSILFPERVDRSFIHRGDYVSRHMIEASASPASCRRCHGPAFCDSCHQEQGVSDALPAAFSPHPRGWANDRGSGHFHGDAARRDVSSCAGCHDQGAQAICIGCHASDAGVPRFGGNPHPSGWSKRHDRDDIQENAMCKACHT